MELFLIGANIILETPYLNCKDSFLMTFNATMKMHILHVKVQKFVQY